MTGPRPGVAASAELRLLFLNAFLLRAGRLPWPGRARYVHSAPAVDARAHELGPRLAGRYDVAALSEVFDLGERHAVVSGWRRAQPRRRHHRLRVAVGPPLLRRLPLLKTSGLFTLVDGPALVRTATHLYRTRGHRFLDSDAWAHKGALMVEVDVGRSANLEVFSTHLIAGGDLLLPRERGHRSAVGDFRQAQAHELLDFVRRSHRPGNATLLVGDFNIDALDPSPAYADLAGAMDDAGYDDLWVEHGVGPGWTSDLLRLPAELVVPDPVNPDLCLDEVPSDAPADERAGGRIDHAWLRRPRDGDEVRVEVRAVRRAAFARPEGAEGGDELAYLSDHLGLHLELTLH